MKILLFSERGFILFDLRKDKIIKRDSAILNGSTKATPNRTRK